MDDTAIDSDIDLDDADIDADDEAEDKENNAEDEDEEDDDDDDDDEFDAESIAEKIEMETIYMVPADQRRTSEHMSKFELVQAIGTRISQIEQGSPVFVQYESGTPVRDIAINEFIQRKCPLFLRRTVEVLGGTKKVELWRVSEMTYPVFDRNKLKINVTPNK